MKPNLLLLVISTVGCAFGEIIERNVIDARAIDPQTMDPTKLSVLKVLKTAIPTDAPMPTGDVTPEWYVELPADVKSILPVIYPATVAAEPPSPTGLLSYPVSNIVASSVVAASAIETTTVSPSPSYTTTVVSLWTSYTTITKTLQHNATSHASSDYPFPTANGTVGNGTSVPKPTGPAAPSASEFLSVGTRNTAVFGPEAMAAAVWVAVGFGFFLLA